MRTQDQFAVNLGNVTAWAYRTVESDGSGVIEVYQGWTTQEWARLFRYEAAHIKQADDALLKWAQDERVKRLANNGAESLQ